MNRISAGSSLNQDMLNAEELQLHEAAAQSPVTVLQIGEGNFLRGFFDWMIHECRMKGLFPGSIAVTQPRPSGKAKIEALAAQDGLYTLVTRGLENGERVERKQILSVFSRIVDPYAQWQDFLNLAAFPELRFVVSNTTEAGLAYRPEPLLEGQPVQSFPGKLALLLFKRYVTFEGAPDKGLIMLPTELLERNGDELKRCVLQFCADWNLPEAFVIWVKEHNRFLNSLVDRIVTGYPSADAEAWFGEWGYRDELLDTAEPYHLWAIEGEAELERELPLQTAGLNVHWVKDLTPFQQRKVRILNGAHTLMTPLALLEGLEQVREVMEHPRFGPFVREAVQQEIIPVVAMDAEELQAYADSVFERYLNPFIVHRLTDIAMNSLSKFKVRLLPSLLASAAEGGELPVRLTLAFAGLLRYYQVRQTDQGYEGSTFKGDAYVVRDDLGMLALISGIWSKAEERQEPLNLVIERLLGSTEIWGQDLNAVSGLTGAVITRMNELEGSPHE